jgi:transcriptional regulator with XRE-family HTH domain
MTNNPRFIAINGRELRNCRLVLGWTQFQLAKSAGYTERLIRKAEKGGTLDIVTIQNLAEALSTPDRIVSPESLMLDIASIARTWFETFDRLKIRMLPEIQPLLTEDFEFVCPGDPSVLPFVGVWKGTDGMQQWLDKFFGFFEENLNSEVEYTVGENTVIARWLATCKYQGVPCPPIRINMHFRFVDGLIARIVDDYDTHAGATSVAEAQAKVQDDDHRD